MPRLIVKFQGTVVQVHEVTKSSIRIGRRPGNDIRIDNLAVSGNHAKIEKVDGSYIIVDLKSTNGTYVNNKKILQAKLNHMDEITIGRHTIVFEDETQVTRPQETPSEIRGPQEEPEKTAPVQGPPPQGRLKFLEPEGKPEILLKKGLTVIGKKEDADIKLKGLFDPKVAALIARGPSGYSIIPQEKGKVKLNGSAISERAELKDGDVIEVGPYKMVYAAR
jgi:pSer/pThr/pTyr-binding forkhead associated (FHA) protein